MRLALRLFAGCMPNAIKVFLYRLMGMKIGSGVRVGFGTVLLCDQVELLDGVTIGRLCVIRGHSLHMGKRSEIYNLVKIAGYALIMKSQSVIASSNEIAGDIHDPRSVLYMGPSSWILQHCYINVARKITLGRNVGVGGGSYLFTHGLWLSKLDGFPISYGEIVIEDDVWLPWGCFLLPNVTIGKKAIIGARSVINRSIPEGVLAAGIPAKVIRDKSYVDLTPEQRADILCELTQDYAQQSHRVARIERSPELDRHFVDDILVLALHKTAGQKHLPQPTLNVIYSKLDPPNASGFSVWSLVDYSSTPYRELSQETRDWFSHARTIGIRFYPIDEDLD